MRGAARRGRPSASLSNPESRHEIEFASAIAPGALVVFAAKDGVLSRGAQAIDTATGGQVTRAIKAARFEGEAATLVEILAPAGSDATRVLVAGTGPAGKADAGMFERIGGAIAARLLASGETSVSVDFDGLTDIAIPLGDAAARLAHGAVLRGYRFDRYRTKMKPNQKPTLETIVLVGAPADAGAASARLAAVAAGVALTRDLVSEPANIIYPESFVERAQALAEAGVTIEVLGEPEMRAAGMGALLGVSQGSVRPPRLLVLR